MKLNNKGWGTAEMFLLSGGLLIALLVAIFFISKLYGSLDASVSNKHYVDLENNLEMSARDYLTDNNIEVVSGFRISYEFLKNNGYIDELNDKNGNSCSGYVIVNNIDNINYYKGYISCAEYKTSNY